MRVNSGPMVLIKHSCLFGLVLLVILYSPVSADQLDIFNSAKPFPVDFLVKSKRLIQLDGLTKKQAIRILPFYLTSKKKIDNPDYNNILNLSIGYLYLKIGEPENAEFWLKNKILGNFVLEDYRLFFRSIALEAIGTNHLNNNKYISSIKAYRKSIKLLLRIHHSFPESPFIENIDRIIAEAEEKLGNAYVRSMNYKAAWRSYRSSLMRIFDDNNGHQLRVRLALASVYEASGNLKESSDMYAFLLPFAEDEKIKVTIKSFIEKYKHKIKEKNISLNKLIAWNNNLSRNQRPLKKIHKDIDFSSDDKNIAIREFYDSLNMNNFPVIVRKAWLVLNKFPGIESSIKVIEDVNPRIVKYLKNNPWTDILNPLINLYPSKVLSSLAYELWLNRKPDSAAVLYKIILEQYPLETEVCHKSLFFLGRIFEDKKEYLLALHYYRQLIKKYEFGRYTPAALFKIPWILRFQGYTSESVEGFNAVLLFNDSNRFIKLKKAFNLSNSFAPAAYYWMAKSLLALGKEIKANTVRQTLIRKFPFNFYSVVSRIELDIGLDKLVDNKYIREIDLRAEGLGDIQKKRLLRAEHLISVGLMEYGVKELSFLEISDQESVEFVLYLVKLYHMAGEFRKSIRLSWRIVKNSKLDRLEKNLRDFLYPKAYLKEVLSELNNSFPSPFFVLALMRQESGFDAKALSSAKAIGLMQLLPSTARDVAFKLGEKVPNEEDLKIPNNNIKLGIHYLKHLLIRFKKNPVYALASYNAGPHKVEYWRSLRPGMSSMEFIESIPYNETRAYVKSVLRNYYMYSTFYGNRSFYTDQLLDISNGN